MSEMPVIPCRQYCQICGNLYAVDYNAADEIWKEAIHPYYQNSTVCLSCFIQRADEKLLDWDLHISLYPMSLVRNLRESRGLRV